MSGPKVVRVVTREEIQAICRGQLARLDRAVTVWIRDGRRHETVTEEEVAAAQRRRDQITDLLSKDRFLDLQKAVAEEIAFLHADQQARLEKAALVAARARTAERRQADAAIALLAGLRRQGGEVPVELLAALEQAGKGKGQVAAALSAGFAALSRPRDEDRSRLLALARSLKEEVPTRSLEDWMAQQPPSADELSFTRIEARLGELATLAGNEAALGFQARLTELRGGAGGQRRSLLLDSVSLDLGAALAAARAQAETRRILEAGLAELSTLDPAKADTLDTVAPTTEAMRVRAAEVEAAIAGAREALAAASRREAVLQGLAALGYEVGAELETAWVQDGRVVLRKPGLAGYGVEVAGGASADRLQMRVVGFGDEADDVTRDRDAETLWCGDVSDLQARLAKSGASLVIEKASPVGSAPIKRVRRTSAEDWATAREGPAPKSRTLS